MREARGRGEDNPQTRRRKGRAGGIKRMRVRMRKRVFQAWHRRCRGESCYVDSAPDIVPDGILTDHVRIVEPNGGDDVAQELGGEFSLQLRIKARGYV